MSEKATVSAAYRGLPGTTNPGGRIAALRALLAALLLPVCGAAAANPQIVDGNYLRYEDTQYESIFLPCFGTEVWSIAGGAALGALVDYYRNSRASASAEIRTALLLHVSPVDKAAQPGAPIDAEARALAIVSISEAEYEILACRAQ